MSTLNQDTIKRFLKNKIKDLQSHTFDMECKTSSDCGYLGDVIFIKIVIHKCKDRKINVVLKVIKPTYVNEPMVTGLFNREVDIYTKVYPAFVDLADAKLSSSKFTGLPHCFGYSENQKSLILEDLVEKGYKLWPLQKPLTMQHSKLVLKQLARWHAFSFGLRDQRPDKFAEVASFRKEIWIGLLRNTKLYEMYHNTFLKSVKYLEGCVDAKIFNWYKDLAGNYEDVLLNKNIDVKDLEKYSAICHEDCWNNNFMFKYEDLDGKNSKNVTDVSLLDWQCSTLSLPIFDVAHFIFPSSDSLQLSNLKCLLEYYYEELSNFIKDLGSCPEQVYPLEVFKKHWMKHSLRGFITAPSIILFTIGQVSSEDNDNDGNGSEDKPFNSVQNFIPLDAEEYKRRLVNLVTSYVNFKF